MKDNVNHPAHYETGQFECFDVMLECLGQEVVLEMRSSICIDTGTRVE